jgi:NADP-dependent 3-hydroxy acid dehydrogenase YdfG
MSGALGPWRGATALVTGASSGIGRAIALRLAREGMNVVGCARREAALEALARERPAEGGEIVPFVADLRDEEQILRMFRAVRERFGGVGVLVNNAGLGRHAPLASGATADWREMLEVNVLALCVCAREALRDMRARGDRGHVVHVSSMAGHRVPEGSGVYAATKHAVRALTEALRLELREAASAVRVSSVSPGYVETEFAVHYHRSEEAARRTYGRYRCLQPEDIADAVAWLIGQPAHVEVHDVLLRPTEQRH